MTLLRLAASGLYCERGGFHIDPWGPVSRAVVTHAHGDHATRGSAQYFTAVSGMELLRSRVGKHAKIEGVPYRQTWDMQGVKVSFHPAGHILGSAQVRVEFRDEVWVVSGDYLTQANPSCEPFEAVPCTHFITESTFAHPYFRWPDPQTVFDEIQDWWRRNQLAGKASLLYGYALGKTQRILASLDSSIGPIFAHADIEELNQHYRSAGIALPQTRNPHKHVSPEDWSRGLFLLPPGSRWKQPFPFMGHYGAAFVSGWMSLPGTAAERGVETGFALSDHADHDEILRTIRATGAQNIFVTHGYIEELVAELQSLGLNARPLRTPHSKRPPRIPVGAAPDLPGVV